MNEKMLPKTQAVLLYYPGKLHRRVKALAAMEGRTIKELITQAIEEYVEEEENTNAGNYKNE